ncbi:Uncharacterised protein [uncultured archaeon]|nr:Uncharacterised protein [uncultured archaeon]
MGTVLAIPATNVVAPVSPSERVNASNAPEIAPALTSGSQIVLNARKGEAPSVAAALALSPSISIIAACVVRTTYENVNAICRTTMSQKPGSISPTPCAPQKSAIERPSALVGTIRGKSIMVSSASLSGNFFLASSHARGMPNKRSMAVTIIAMANDVSMASCILAPNSSFPNFVNTKNSGLITNTAKKSIAMRSIP